MAVVLFVLAGVLALIGKTARAAAQGPQATGQQGQGSVHAVEPAHHAVTAQGDADVRRVYGKCLSGRLQTAAECQSIADVMSDWKAGRAEPAGRAGPAPGPSFSYVFPGHPAVGGTALPPRAAPVVPGSCLLYTSPSPPDRTRSRMPSSP